MAGFQFGQATLTGRGEARTLRGLVATHDYFPLLGMRPLLGRLFGDADDRPGAAAAIVVNHAFWAGALGGEPSIVGATLTLDGRPYEVVGVAAPIWEARPVDYYLPLGRVSGADAGRGRHATMRVLGRLRPGVTLAAARDDLDAIMRRSAIAAPGPEDDHQSFARMLADQTAGDAQATLLPLMAAAGLVLVIACANVANMLLARAVSRQREIAVRLSLGAGRGRVVLQLLTESLVLAVPAALAAFALSRILVAGAVWLMFATVPSEFLVYLRVAPLAADGHVFAFMMSTAMASALAFG
jgi:hypothetical protein